MRFDAPIKVAMGLTLPQRLSRLERALIRRAVKQAHGNTAHAARILGVNRTTLVMKMKRLGMQ